MQFPSFTSLPARLTGVRTFIATAWQRYRALALWIQGVIAVVFVAVLFMLGHSLFGGSATALDEATLPTVTLASVDALTGSGSSVTAIGSVRSISEAALLAQSGGTVTAVHSALGSYVSAGFIIAELDNASQRAALLQAEGSYDAALAARSGLSAGDITTAARNTYTTAFSTMETLLKSDIDLFYGEIGGQGPQFLISPSPFDFAHFPIKRQTLTDAMTEWRSHLSSAATANPQTLLDEAERITRQAISLGNDMAQAANRNGTDATSAQLAALAAARAGFTSLQASITAAKIAFQGQNTSAGAGADASVKIALGSLRAAQAQLEKTFVRAPISGTINFLPIRRGDYVAALTHVATVAQNGTLEIVTYVSEENRALLSVGTKVTVEDLYSGVVTTVSPALDPVTKQIEVHLVIVGKTPLVNGQSVRVALPNAPAAKAVSGPQLLPLTTLKLTPSARVVFSVGEDSRLVAHAVQIGEVHGDRIEILSALPSDLLVVTDARGFSEGQKVTVSAR